MSVVWRITDLGLKSGHFRKVPTTDLRLSHHKLSRLVVRDSEELRSPPALTRRRRRPRLFDLSLELEQPAPQGIHFEPCKNGNCLISDLREHRALIMGEICAVRMLPVERERMETKTIGDRNRENGLRRPGWEMAAPPITCIEAEGLASAHGCEDRIGGVERLGMSFAPTLGERAAKCSLLIAKEGSGSEVERGMGAPDKDGFDLRGLPRRQYVDRNLTARSCDCAVEMPIHEVDANLVQARDDEDERRRDQEPGPGWKGKMLVNPLPDIANALMQHECRHAEQDAEYGDATQRDRNGDNARPPHGLEHQEAEHSVDEPHESPDLLLKPFASEQVGEERGVFGRVGENDCGQADQAAIDDPAQALIVVGRQLLAAHEENREDRGHDDQPGEDADTRYELRAIAEEISVACAEQHGQEDGDRRQGTFERTPGR